MVYKYLVYICFILKKCFFSVFEYFFSIYLYLERGQGEREGEKHKCVVASCVPPTGDLVTNPGMCPDWESNLWLFGSQAKEKSTEPHQPGLISLQIAPNYLLKSLKDLIYSSK